MSRRPFASFAFAALAVACAPGCSGSVDDAAGADAGPAVAGATAIASFSPGEGAGFGEDQLPGIVLGGPKGGGDRQGSLDVLSLGSGGTLVLDFAPEGLVDGPGVDFIVFENAFYAGGNPLAVYAELAEVSVSEDGVTFASFPCDIQSFRASSCAGWHPVYASPESGIAADDPARAGGDPFDLAALGVARARYVKIHDLSTSGAAPTAGFDLDAVVLVHHAPISP